MYPRSAAFGHLIHAIMGHRLHVGAVGCTSYRVYMMLGSDKCQRIFKKGLNIPTVGLRYRTSDLADWFEFFRQRERESEIMKQD